MPNGVSIGFTLVASFNFGDFQNTRIKADASTYICLSVCYYVMGNRVLSSLYCFYEILYGFLQLIKVVLNS